MATVSNVTLHEKYGMYIWLFRAIFQNEQYD